MSRHTVYFDGKFYTSILSASVIPVCSAAMPA
jgi:hypothetical protein